MAQRVTEGSKRVEMSRWTEAPAALIFEILASPQADLVWPPNY